MHCQLDHVHIVCRDLDNMIRVFTGDFGARLIGMKIFGGVDGASLDLGGTLINLRVKQPRDNFMENPSGKTYGYHHIGLLVDDVDASYRELRDKGYQFTAPPEDVVGFRVAFFAGPEDMVFELVQVRPVNPD